MDSLRFLVLLLVFILLNVGCSPETKPEKGDLVIGELLKIEENFFFYFSRGFKTYSVVPEELVQQIISDATWFADKGLILDDTQLIIKRTTVNWYDFIGTKTYKYSAPGLWIVARASIRTTKDVTAGEKKVSIKLPGLKAVATALNTEPRNPYDYVDKLSRSYALNFSVKVFESENALLEEQEARKKLEEKREAERKEQQSIVKFFKDLWNFIFKDLWNSIKKSPKDKALYAFLFFGGFTAFIYWLSFGRNGAAEYIDQDQSSGCVALLFFLLLCIISILLLIRLLFIWP